MVTAVNVILDMWDNTSILINFMSRAKTNDKCFNSVLYLLYYSNDNDDNMYCGVIV